MPRNFIVALIVSEDAIPLLFRGILANRRKITWPFLPGEFLQDRKWELPVAEASGVPSNAKYAPPQNNQHKQRRNMHAKGTGTVARSIFEQISFQSDE
jgi:hypothetical protein